MAPWLGAGELRVGLGCMRLSTDEERDTDRAEQTIRAALAAGITVFDTARAYGRDEAERGHNERLVARALRAGATDRVRIVTKGGMRRDGGRWVPDGRAKALRADCEGSLAALDGLPIDLYLVHTPDPRTPWRTTVHALMRLLDEGLVRTVGVSNVTRKQLDEALALAPLAAIQVALSPLDDRALRGGLVERCEQAGVALLAHSPLGGPRRRSALERNAVLVEVAAKTGASAAEVALAWLLDLSPVVIPIPGARRAETARSAAQAARLRLEPDERETLARAFGRARRAVQPPAAKRSGEVVLVMGIPGAGKSRVAATYVARGYERLNRDERAGTLRGLATVLDETLAAGRREVVLDNTYLGRDARSHVVDAASRHGVRVRCIWLDTPLAGAQVNLVRRLLEVLGRLPSVEELRGGQAPGVVSPTAQMRALRGLEPPMPDEGFDEIERVPFERSHGTGAAVVFVATSALENPSWPRALRSAVPEAPHLVFDWRPGARPDALAAAREVLRTEVGGPVEAALCPHPAGPPICWCRPPLPGLPLAFAHTHGADPARSVLVGTSTAHRQLAAALGARLVVP